MYLNKRRSSRIVSTLEECKDKRMCDKKALMLTLVSGVNHYCSKRATVDYYCSFGKSKKKIKGKI